jgi:predicted Ser/Thr protein kinase
VDFKEFGDYEIEGELGRGGMGVVYLAKQLELNRRVALKMLTGHYVPEDLRRFLDEAETVASLNHTNIAHIYEVGEHDGVPFFSMEFVEGGSLSDLIRKKSLTPREIAALMISIARAVHYAHQTGVVHRDLKPANVLLDLDGVPKVADFGIAKRLHEDTDLTRTGSIMGTPTYMSPEQARGHSKHVGPPADIYSLGAILYEMLAGRPPFLPEDSEVPVTVRVLNDDPVSPAFHNSGIPRDLETICMKCLAKEPRQRYQTAAGLAEDLRRYLDDETILAKPPSTVVSSFKWVRRHPWRSIGAGVAVLVVVALFAVSVHWFLYQRMRIEYATQIDWKNGVLEPLVAINSAKAARSESYIRLTRRGLLGPIIKAEVLNSLGNPAVLRRTFNAERIPIYVEGLGGAQPFTEKLPETSSIDFVFDDRGVREATSRDRNNQVNWRVIYDSAASSDSIARARFVNLRDFEASSSQRASHLEFERDKKGFDTKVSFFDAAGKPAANGEGVYGYKIERDEKGLITRLTNLDASGAPTANRVGLTEFTLSWGTGIRFEPKDGKGQPALWNNISAVVTDLDSDGNSVRIANLGSDGQPVRDAANEWSVQEIKRDAHGEIAQRTFFKADANGALKQISQTEVAYDEFGHPADIKFVGNASWHSALRYDQSGNIIEEKYLNAEGQPMVGDKGYAITRSSYTSTAQGLRVEQTYFGIDGKKTYSKSGYHRLINEYDVTGFLKRMTQDEHDPSQYKFYRYVTEPQYDSEGRSRKNISRFEDAQGQLATNAGLAYTSEETNYDEKGRLTSSVRFGADFATFGGPIVVLEIQWESNGKMRQRTRQVCDANRQPLSMVSNGTAARFEEDFDFNEQRQLIKETGFDEKVVGFNSREARFSNGNLQDVIFALADGSRVSSIAVFISEVIPPANQPKSSELKAGDQLVAVNGKPVTSAYGYVFSGTFPGGSVDVLRAGQRIRIDGFNSGSLGVILEDRAANLKHEEKKVA